MPNTLYRPVVLSYFSQNEDSEEADHRKKDPYLRFLEDEYDSIAKAWEQYHIQTGSDRYFEVFFPARGSADGDKVVEDTISHKKRIILFHFSGHATSKHLIFKDGASNASGIAGLLGEADNLKLVVLNGCGTYDQVNLLFNNKVKVVVATKGKVLDGKAMKFAGTFYNALSKRDTTIRSAYNLALNELERKSADTIIEPIIWRGLDTESEGDRDHWELYVKEEWEELIDDPNWWRIGDLPSSYARLATLLSPKGVDNPNVFLGRKDELEAIRERLVKGGKLMLINAEGGIGKTTLAARYWNESLYEYQRNAWLFCENGIVNALKELAPKLHVDLVGLDETQQLATLRNALSQIHDDFLLVLDNANDAEDIRVFRQEFAGFHWHVLITSRCQGVLEKEQELSITHLPPTLAKELFVKYYKEDSTDFDTMLDRLLNAISYHTLLVEIFAKNLKEASELGTTLTYFLQKLKTGGLHLGEDSFEVKTSYTDSVKKKAATTDHILDILYDFSPLSLPENQRYLLVNLALLLAENYTLLFLIELFVPTDKRAFRSTVKSLYHKGWLSGTENTYRLSPVVQALVLKKNEGTLPTDAEALLNNLAEKMDNDKHDFNNLSLPEIAPLAHFADNLTQHLLHNPTSELASLNYNAGLYFEKTGDLVQAKRAFKKYGQINKAIGDTEKVAASCSKLGSIYEAIGDFKKALENYQQQLRIFQELYQSTHEILSYKNGLAVSYQNLANIYNTTGEWEKALENYQEHNRLSLETHQSNPENLAYKKNLAISYQSLGNIHNATGEWEKALENYQEYNRLSLDIHQRSPVNLSYKNNLAVSYSKLGTLFLQKNEVKVSLNHFLQGRTLFEELWKATQGQNVKFTFYFALSSRDVSRIVKWMIQNDYYEAEDIREHTKHAEQVRREGYAALQPLGGAGALQQDQLKLLQELADESWYEF